LSENDRTGIEQRLARLEGRASAYKIALVVSSLLALMLLALVLVYFINVLTMRAQLEVYQQDLAELKQQVSDQRLHAQQTPPPRRKRPNPKTPPANKPTPKNPTTKIAPKPRSIEGVTKLGEHHFLIAKTTLDEHLADLNSIINQAQLVPNFVGPPDQRRIDGFRLYLDKTDSIFKALGLKGGDVLKSINGAKLDGVESGLTLFQTLRHETHFTLVIERRQFPIELHYQIQ